MKKRIIAIALAALFCMSCCSLVCFAADGADCGCGDCHGDSCTCCDCHHDETCDCCDCGGCEADIHIEDGIVSEDIVAGSRVNASVVGDYEFSGTNFANTTVKFAILSEEYTADTVTIKVTYKTDVFAFVSATTKLKTGDDYNGKTGYTTSVDPITGNGVIMFEFPRVTGIKNAYSLVGTVTIAFRTLKTTSDSTVIIAGEGVHEDNSSDAKEDNPYKVDINAGAVVKFCTHSRTYTVIDKEPTCTTKGVKNTYCSNCFKLISTEEIPMSDHKLPATPAKIKAATCTAAGTAEYVCTVCGKTVEKAIPIVAHTLGAKYQKDGFWYQRCSVCNTEVKSAIQCEHELSDYTLSTVIKEPTCSTLGTGIYQCSKCKSLATFEIPMTAHQYEFTKTLVSATATTNGSELWTCKVCGETETRVTEKLTDHTIHVYNGKEVIVVPATCTEDGMKNVYCSVTGCTKYTQVLIKAAGHKWSEWTETKAATCTENGTKTRTCSVCGEVETAVIPALTHSWIVNSSTDENGWTTVNNPSCVADGLAIRECGICHETEEKTLPASNEYCTYPDGDYTITIPATCSSEGTMTCICPVCKKTVSTKTIPIDAEAHSWSEWKVVSDSTCITTGERTRTCAYCGKTETETVPASGHIFTDVTDKKGVVTRTCSVCHTKEVITTLKNGTSKAMTHGEFMLVFGDTATAGKDIFFTIAQVGIDDFNIIKAFDTELQKYYRSQGYSDEKAAAVTIESAYKYMLKIAGTDATVSSASQLVIELGDEYKKTSFDIWYLNENSELTRVSPNNVARKGTTITIDIGSGTFKYPSDTIVLVNTGAKTANYAVPITVAVLTIVIAAGVVFFVISKNRKVSF